MICSICNIDNLPDNCLIVIIETDTGGTLASRKIGKDAEQFNNRYHELVDSGRYPNMSSQLIECKACRNIRYREMEEESEYWRQKNGFYD